MQSLNTLFTSGSPTLIGFPFGRDWLNGVCVIKLLVVSVAKRKKQETMSSSTAALLHSCGI